MTTDGEGKAVQQFVLEDPVRIETAAAVYASWPAIKDRVCRESLERLRSGIEARAKGLRADLVVGCGYEGEEKYGNYIGMCRDSWAQYRGTDGSQLERCTTIRLQNQERGPNGWCIGVASPVVKEEMTPREKKRRRRLEVELESALCSTIEENTWWPWRSEVDEYGNWDSLVLAALHKENQNNGGPITSHFVDEFIRIAKKAVPTIDDIEGRGNS